MPISTSSWNSSINGTYPQEFQDRYRNLGDAIYDGYSNVNSSLLRPVFSTAESFTRYWTVGEAFVAWFFHNLSGGATTFGQGGHDWEHPYQYQYSPTDKSHALRSLGCRSDDDGMCNTFRSRNGGGGPNEQGSVVGNTLFNLSQCDPANKSQKAPFEWGSDGSLCVYDRYGFDSPEDFSSSQGGIFGVLSAFASVPGCYAVNVNANPIGQWRDAFFNYINLVPNKNAEPYQSWEDSNNPIKKALCSGNSRFMYTKACFSAAEVREYNPELYYDRLRKGLISYTSVPGALEVGTKQPSPIVGMSFQPPVSVDIQPGPNYFGFDYGDYPAPFNSGFQAIVNETYDLGPYAKLSKFVVSADPSKNFKDSTCEDGEDLLGKTNDQYGLYGRIIIITSGANAGDLGFVLQDWYHFNDEPYNTVDGTSSGQRYQSKAQWWENATKIPMQVRFIHVSGQPLVTVKVAASGPIYGDSNYYPGPNLSSANNLSYSALQLMTASAALARWL